MSDVFPSTNAFSLIRSSTLGTGESASISVNSANLLAENGGAISTTSSASGNAGNLDVDVSDTITISGFVPDFLTPSSVSSYSFVKGNTGNVNLNSKKLNILNSGLVSSLSTGQGDAGEVNVTVSENILVTGRLIDEPIVASAIASSAEKIAPNTAAFFSIPPLPSGDAGDVTITTPSLEISQGGIVAVRNTGTGDAGNLEINADSISLDNGGEISASTVSGEGGNITIGADNLLLSDRSNITTNAGGQGNGGNIQIDTEVLAGLENSDITANAVRGNGGNINVTSDFVFGLESRPELTPFSDITASSELGIDGTVTIDSPDTDLIKKIIIAARSFDRPREIPLPGSSCLNAQGEGIQFFNLGSGIPENPYNPVYDDEQLAPGAESVAQTQTNTQLPYVWKPGDPIIEANTVVTLPDGRQFLTVASSPSNPTVAPPQLCPRP